MATHSSTREVEGRESNANDQPGILETLISKATMTAGKASLRHPQGLWKMRGGVRAHQGGC